MLFTISRWIDNFPVFLPSSSSSSSAAAAAAAAAPSFSSFPWPHQLDFADHLLPPYIHLLAAVPTALSLVFVPNFIKVCLLIAITGSYDNVHPRQQVHEIITSMESKADGEGGGREGGDHKHHLSSSSSAVSTTAAKGYLIRAVACHHNAWEGFIMFTAAAILAHITHVDHHVASSLATLFLTARLAFTFLYVFGRTPAIAMLRSAVWFISIFVIYRLMHLAVLHSSASSSNLSSSCPSSSPPLQSD